MSQYESKLYEPTDDARVFDGGDDDFQEDESSRLPLLIVIALVVLASFAGVVWVAYTQGVQRGRQDAPRILAAEQDNNAIAGERKNPYAKLQIYNSTKRTPETDQSAASPISPERVSPATTDQSDEPVATGAPENARDAEASSSSVPGQAQHASTATKAIASPAHKMAAPKPITSPSDVVRAVSERYAANGGSRPANQPATPSFVDLNAMPQPSQTPAQGSAQSQAASINATQAAQSASRPTEGYVLQIGSYASEAEANASWQSYRQAHASVSDYTPKIEAADLGKRGTWYRLRIGPFANLVEASAICAKLKVQGASCFPAKK